MLQRSSHLVNSAALHRWLWSLAGWMSQSHRRWLMLVSLTCLPLFWVPGVLEPRSVNAQPAGGRNPLTLRADIQEANARTGVITARGNVQINYPARRIQATAAQAQYFSRERRIVLSGDVYVLQDGNSLRGEVITYLIDEGRFIATPRESQQVQSIYIIQEPSEDSTAPRNPPPFESR